MKFIFGKLIKELERLNSNIELFNENIRSNNNSLPQAKRAKPVGESVAIVGVRGHGTKHIAAFNKLKNCYVSWICDVDTKVGKAAVDAIHKETGYKPNFTTDYREMLKDKTVDLMTICTPHHWHALQAIDGLRAGKHVYIEKPLTQYYNERFALKAAAAKYGKLVQAGTQLRSNTSLKAAGKYMRSGKLGDITLVHCIVHKDRPAVPLSNESKVPTTVDLGLWTGPRKESAITRSKFHYHWHWLWEFGNGALGNNGIHRIDAARIALDLEGYGDRVISMGDRYGAADSGETPNNMLTLHQFGNTWILQDILGLNPEPYKGMENAVIFYGTNGTIVYKSGYAALVDENFVEMKRFEGKQLNHYYNMLLAIRDRDPSILRGDLEEGLISSELCHFGNISYRVGTKGDFVEARDKLRNLRVPEFVFERLDALQLNLTQNDVVHEIKIGETLELGECGAKNPILNSELASEFLSENTNDKFLFPSENEV